MGVFTNVNGVIREAKEIYVNHNNVIRKVKSGRVGPDLAVPGEALNGVPQMRSYFDYEFDLRNTGDAVYVLFLLRQVRPTHQNLQRAGVHDSRWSYDSTYLSYYFSLNNELSAWADLNTTPFDINLHGYASNSRYQWQLNLYIIDNSSIDNKSLSAAKFWTVFNTNEAAYGEKVHFEWEYRPIYLACNPYRDRGTSGAKEYKNMMMDVHITATPTTQYVANYINPYIVSRNGVTNHPWTSSKEYSLFPNDNRTIAPKTSDGVTLEWKMMMGVLNENTAYEKTTVKYTFDFRNRIKADGKPIKAFPIVIVGEDDWDKVHPITFPWQMRNKSVGDNIFNEIPPWDINSY
jgi:hypothetical protein